MQRFHQYLNSCSGLKMKFNRIIFPKNGQMKLQNVDFNIRVTLKPLTKKAIDQTSEYDTCQNDVLKFNRYKNRYRPSLSLEITRAIPVKDRPMRVGRDISVNMKGDPSILDKFVTKSKVQEYCSGKGCVDLASRGCLLINSGCGSGKTEAGIKIIELVQRRTLIITTRENICKQWMDRLRVSHPRLIIGYDQIDSSYDVSCCTSQFLLNHQEAFKDVGLIIIDEAHTIIGCTYFIPIMKALATERPPFCLALTATIPYDETERYSKIKYGNITGNRDIYKNKSFMTVFGAPVKFEDKEMKDIEINRIAVRFNNECSSSEKLEAYFQCMDRVKLDVKDRYGLVLTRELVENANVAVKLADRYKIPVEIIYDTTIGFKTVYPGTNYVDVQQIRSHPIMNRNCRIYVCTVSRASTGYDDPRLSWAITLHDPASNNVFIQTFGRIKRFSKFDDKKKFIFMPEFEMVSMKIGNEYRQVKRSEIMNSVSSLNEAACVKIYQDKMGCVRPKVMEELNVKTVLEVNAFS